MAKYLILTLQGPMQAWGRSSYFDYRTSETLPTKSGIIGLISAAMGIPREDRERIERLNTIHMAAICMKGGASSTDFHTVGAGYDNLPEKERILHQLPTADRGQPSKRSKSPKIPHKVAVTYREYLYDYRFEVILWGDSSLIEECAKAMCDGVWGGTLGRKNCLPTRPIFTCTCDTVDQVKKYLGDNGFTDKNKVQCEIDNGVTEDYELIQDVPTCFGNKRADRMRRVTSRLVL